MLLPQGYKKSIELNDIIAIKISWKRRYFAIS